MPNSQPAAQLFVLPCWPQAYLGPELPSHFLLPHQLCSSSIGSRGSARRQRASCMMLGRSTAMSQEGGKSRRLCRAAISSRVAGRSACAVRQDTVLLKWCRQHHMLACCLLPKHVGTGRTRSTSSVLASRTSGTRTARCSSSRSLSRSLIAAMSASCGQGSTTSSATRTRQVLCWVNLMNKQCRHRVACPTPAGPP